MEEMPVVQHQQLQELLRVWRKSFDELLVPKQEKLEEARKAGHSINLTGQEKYQVLKERLKVLEGEWTDKALVVGKKLDQMALYETEVAKASKDLNHLNDWIIRLTEWRDRREKFISEDLQALQELAETAKKNTAKVQVQLAHIAWYQNFFGVRCEYSRGIKFIFSKVDPSQVDREFSITLYHDERVDKYSMLDCQPPIKAAQGLVDILNRNNEFFKFVRRIRKEFQSLVCAQSDGRV